MNVPIKTDPQSWTESRQSLQALKTALEATTAADIPIADAGTNYTATNVETALAEIHDLAEALPAANVTIADSGNNYTATNVETALAEIHDLVEGWVTDSAGTAGASCAAVESGVVMFHKTVLTITNLQVTINDGGANGNAVVYTFPAGFIKMMGGLIDATVVCTANFNADPNDTFECAFGTAAGSGALTTTEADLIPSTEFDTASGGTTSFAFEVGGGTDGSAGGPVGSPATLKWNIHVGPANDNGNNTFTLTGTLTFIWLNLGSY